VSPHLHFANHDQATITPAAYRRHVRALWLNFTGLATICAGVLFSLARYVYASPGYGGWTHYLWLVPINALLVTCWLWPDHARFPECGCGDVEAEER